jgi:hypothetical protein
MWHRVVVGLPALESSSSSIDLLTYIKYPQLEGLSLADLAHKPQQTEKLCIYRIKTVKSEARNFQRGEVFKEIKEVFEALRPEVCL